MQNFSKLLMLESSNVIIDDAHNLNAIIIINVNDDDGDDVED